MIGTSSFILELMGVLFPLAIFLSAIYLLWSRRRRGDYVFVALAGVMIFLMGTRYVYQVHNHFYLSHLSADEVASIQIGQASITDEAEIRSVVAALNESRWFSSDHGGWAQTVSLIIIMKDGHAYRYRVGYYLREEGAVIQFYRSWAGVDWSDGYSFNQRLPAVLKQLGEGLPSQH